MSGTNNSPSRNYSKRAKKNSKISLAEVPGGISTPAKTYPRPKKQAKKMEGNLLVITENSLTNTPTKQKNRKESKEHSP